MFTDKSKVRIYIPKLLHKSEEANLIKEFSDVHDIPFENIKILSNEVQNVSKSIEKEIKNAEKNGNTLDIYADYLKDKQYNRTLFQQIDNEVSLEVNFTFTERSNYKLKYISAYNLTSYGNVTLHFDGYFGTVGIFSKPSNFGGKSNLYKLIQVLLWGKYLSLDEYSTLPSLFNNYIKKDHAYVEGSLELNGRFYFIRREFKKESKKRVKHDVYTYEIVDQTNADKYVYIFNDSIKEINKGDYNPSLPDGIWVKTMSKNETEAFYNAIGKIEDFVKICLFNQSTLYNLILTKKTERTRNFYNLFGGEYYEKKKDIAKEKYSKFKKQSSLHTVNLLDLQKELSEYQNKIKDSKTELTLLLNEISNIEKSISLLEQEKNKKYNSLKIVESFDIDYKKKEELKLASEVEALHSKYIQLETEIKVNEQYERYNLSELKDRYNKCVLQLGSIEENQVLSNEVKNLKLNIEKLNEKIVEISNNLTEINIQKNKIKQDYNSNKNKIKFYEGELSNIPEDVTCNNCGSFVINYNDKRNKINEDIQSLNNKNFELKQEAETLVSQENDIIASKTNLENEISKIKITIKDKESKILEQLKKDKSLLTDEIQKLDNIKEKVEALLKKKGDLISTEELLSVKRVQWVNISNEISQFQNNNKLILEYNEKIKKEIEALEEKLNDRKNIFSFHIEKKGSLGTSIDNMETNIEKISKKIDSFKEEIELDKAYQFYIETHDMNGIIKYMIEGYLPLINRELKSVTQHMDFKVEIFLDQGKYINYRFIRDGKERDLKNVSGCEGYIALTALYLVHIKFSKISLPNIVLFDEVFQISDENVENLYEILKLYNEVFEHVFMIWHGNGLEELVDHHIYIEKKNNISKIHD